MVAPFSFQSFFWIIIAGICTFSCTPSAKHDAPDAAAEWLADFGKSPGYYPDSLPPHDSVSLRSFYLPMPDGVPLAIDLYLPEKPTPANDIPAILIMTRYWRALDNNNIPPVAKRWTSYGYAVLMVDARGTGASFGTRPWELFSGEIRDYGAVVDWIIAQPWSNGRVGATGGSYLGSTAELLTVNQHPAVRVVIPKFNEFDVYTDIIYPGGGLLKSFISLWGDMVTAMDLHQMEQGIVRRADQTGDSLRLAALEHVANGKVYEQALLGSAKNVPQGLPYDSISPLGLAKAIEASETPMSNWGSWMDAGTADGVLKRFSTFSNRQIGVIGAWSHGGGHHTSPFLPEDTPSNPSPQAQFLQDLKLMDHYLKDLPATIPDESVLFYYTMGEEAWHITRQWPPKGHRLTPWYFGEAGALDPQIPSSEAGEDFYEIDFEHSTGVQNRWYTQLGGGDVRYPDRLAASEQLLVYTSAPLTVPLELTGHPVAHLQLATSSDQGMVFVYLETVKPDGEVLYLSEGQLNLLHRKEAAEKPWTLEVPFRTFRLEDTLTVVPGVRMDLHFALLPTSVVIPAGYRLRISIGGHDKDTFARYPETGSATFTVFRNLSSHSFVELPIIE